MRAVKTSNKTYIRGLENFCDMANLHDAYRYYVNYYFYNERKDGRKPLPEKTYIYVARAILRGIADKVAAGWTVELPYRLGKLYVKGKVVKPYVDKKGRLRGLVVDRRATAILHARDPEAKRKRIKVYINPMFSPVRYKIIWSTAGNPLKNARLYIFKSAQYIRQKVKEAIAAGRTEAYLVDAEVGLGRRDKSKEHLLPELLKQVVFSDQVLKDWSGSLLDDDDQEDENHLGDDQ